MRLAVYVALAMLAFAANSLLCRLALKDTSIDAASFSTVRILSGALTLSFVMQWQTRSSRMQGSWHGALALFIYIVAFFTISS